MIAIKVFRMVLTFFLTLYALAAFAGAQIIDVALPFGPYPLTARTTTSEYTVSDYNHIFDGTTSVYVTKVPRDDEYFMIPPVHSAASASTTVSTVSVFSGPGVFGITATPTLRETASVACSVVFHNPGLALHPCISKATGLSTSRILGSSMVSPTVNISTVTTTQVKSVTTTRTVTLTLSEVSGSSSSVPPVTTVTAMCLWADQAILTPCTSVVAASSKPTSAAAANPLAAAVGVSFLWALALGGLLG